MRGSDANSVFAGRPHAQSMQQTKVSQFKSTRHTLWNSPQLQPTVIGQNASSGLTQTSTFNDDVRSLLYCSSDSDEIESLVFKNSTGYPHDAEESDCEHKCDFKCHAGKASEDSWSTCNSHNLEYAFDCDLPLLHCGKQLQRESQ